MQKITLTERRVSVTVITVNPTKILGIKRGEQMKLSTRAIYGLRAMIDLGVYSEQEAVSIQSIAGRQNISVSYLEQLMAKLKRAGLVESTRGACGGYRLGRPADEISVGDILRFWRRSGSARVSGTSPEENCETKDICVAKLVWKRINDSITQAVDTLMLGQLIEESRKNRKRNITSFLLQEDRGYE